MFGKWIAYAKRDPWAFLAITVAILFLIGGTAAIVAKAMGVTSVNDFTLNHYGQIARLLGLRYAP